jgi:hypothetical protein
MLIKIKNKMNRDEDTDEVSDEMEKYGEAVEHGILSNSRNKILSKSKDKYSQEHYGRNSKYSNFALSRSKSKPTQQLQKPSKSKYQPHQ